MKTLKEVMAPDVVWISPSARAKTAIILLKGHGIDALPVVYSHDSVVGMIYCSSLIGEDPDRLVMDLMTKEYIALPPNTPVYQAAEMMRRNGNSHVLVVDSGRLVGVVSRGDIVSELGKSYDTLTGLPWQDAFREWSIDALDRGHEISVILIDLDLFGKFNKKYGHVMGDNVLKAVAGALQAEVDAERDFLCRYAGDEFAVASYRKSGEANEFGARLIDRVRKIQIPGLPEEIGATFGMAGGRRTGGREAIHSAATLDDLITNASLNCTLSKPHRDDTAQIEPAPVAVTGDGHIRRAEQSRLKIQTIRLSTSPTEATAEVILSRNEQEFAHSSSGYAAGGRSVIRLVADAAAGAASKSFAPGYGIVVDGVVNFEADQREIVTVIATLVGPGSSTTHAGSAVVRRSDPYRAAAAALLSAVNRQAALIPRSEALTFAEPTAVDEKLLGDEHKAETAEQ
ncbi:MAG: CBS domain-containing protein [Armatimonadetes bacterium]|nr:CBS domain-containing protein [Armatimonadota bacterium]